MNQILYISRCHTDWQGASSIVEHARRFNARMDVTGALVFTGGHFAQWLEGDAAVLDALYARIASDPRHSQPVLLSRRHVAVRCFGQWSMGFEERPGADDLLSELHVQGANLSLERSERLMQQLFKPSQAPRASTAP